jgi:hypothetical protein
MTARPEAHFDYRSPLPISIHWPKELKISHALSGEREAVDTPVDTSHFSRFVVKTAIDITSPPRQFAGIGSRR